MLINLYTLTYIPRCIARQATLASSSSSLPNERKIANPRQSFMWPRHISATSRRFVFTHILAKLVQTAGL